MAWNFIPQTEGKGDAKHEVLCKNIEFYPRKDRKTGADAGFGKLTFLCYKVLFEHDVEKKPHSITYSKRPNAEFGCFTYHWPDKKQQKDEYFTSLAALRAGLKKMNRGEFGDRICDEFEKRIGGLLAPKVAA
jgi:hypothetical protein